MADLKISQLPAATAITGAELVELVQSGNNVKSTVSALATPPSPAALIGGFGPGSPNWNICVATGRGGGFVTFGPIPASWVTDSSQLLSAPTVSGATLFAAVGCVSSQTGGGINQGMALYPNQNASRGYRKATNSRVAGFDSNWVFSWSTKGGATNVADQTAFIGWGPGVGTMGNTVIPSALTDIVGFGKDQGDTNLQFMVNNNAGTATKTDTGIPFTSLANHILQVRLFCDAAGALISATFTDLETGGATVTYTVPDAQVKNITQNTAISPKLYSGSGTVNAGSPSVGFAVVSTYFNYGFINE